MAISDVMSEAVEEVETWLGTTTTYEDDRDVIEAVVEVMDWLRRRYDRSPSMPEPPTERDEELTIIVLGRMLRANRCGGAK